MFARSQFLTDCWERLLQLCLQSLEICDACQQKSTVQLALVDAVRTCASINIIKHEHLVPWRLCASTEQTEYVFTACQPRHHLHCAVD